MLQNILIILQKSSKKFFVDDPIKLAATLSFLTLFAIPPILIINTFIIGLFLGEDVVNSKLYIELNELIGPKVARLINDIIFNFRHTSTNPGRVFATAFMFIIASTTFFGVIQKSLNDIWRVRPKPDKFMLKILKDRLISFGIIFCLGLLFFISLVFDALIVVLKDYLNSVLPSYTYVILKTAKFLFSFSAATITFAFLFKFLPDVRIKWRVTWMGAIITAILFSIGKGLITFGLGEFGIASMYGATGTVVIFLLWVFYSALIFYFGAEITEQYALQTSKNIVPKNYAVSFKITEYKEEETEPSANHKEVLETIDKTDMNLS